MSTILVTGGEGLIGKPLVEELKQRGHDVWATGHKHCADSRSIRCDVGSYMQLERTLSTTDPDYIYHLAGEFGRWNGEKYYDTLWRTNVIGTRNIIELQKQLHFKLIFASSSEVYGNYHDTMSEEIMNKHEIRQLNDYALSKWVNEQQIMNSAEISGTESVRMRLFNIYGPGEYYTPYRSVICRFIYHALKGQAYTVYLDHHRSSCYVTDAVRTIANIADNFIAGRVYNIGSTEYHNIKHLSDIILELTGADESIVRYEESEPFTTRDKRVDVTRAVRELGHDPQVSLRDGLGKTVDWMRDTYDESLGRCREGK